MTAIDPTEAAAYLARWTLVGDREPAELRTTPIEVKFQQLCALFASRALFAPDPSEQADDDAVRSRWVRIRAAYHA